MDRRSAAARRTEQEIVRLSHAGLDSRTLRVEALRRLRMIVPVDAVFLPPSTRQRSFSLARSWRRSPSTPLRPS